MEGIKLPIFFHTSETAERLAMSEQLEVDIEIEDEEYDIREMTFYVINAVMPHPDFGRGTMICSNGEEFRSPLSYDEVLKVIEG